MFSFIKDNFFRSLLTSIFIIILSLSSPLSAATNRWVPSFDELMKNSWPDLLDANLSGYFPRMNIQEKENSYHIEAEVPGVKKNDIEVKLKDDFLVITGDKKNVTKESKDKYRRIELANGYFYRAVSIPRDIDKDKITAELKDGVLRIDIEKVKGSPKSLEQKILIK